MKKYLLLVFLLVQGLTQANPPTDNNDDASNNQAHQPKIESQKLSFNDIFANDRCLLPEQPTKLGITCVTRLRARNQQDIPEAVNFFKQFLNRYAEMDCDAFDNIYFIWNNPKPPQQYQGLLDRKSYWKKNVYFIQTVDNGLDHRWALPPWAPQRGFFSLDDDAEVDCISIQKGFSQWKSNFVAGIGPLASPWTSVRHFQYHAQIDRFVYSTALQSYFSIAIPNVGIVDRHFADLYYASFPQFKKMRETVVEMINCDDILLNFMIGYVYPEIRPIVLQEVSARLKPSNVQLNKSPLHYSNRTQAINRYTKILGQYTLGYSMINRNESYEKQKTKPLHHLECLLAMKRSMIEQKYLSYNHYYTKMKGLFYENSSEIGQQLLQKIKMDQYIFSLGLEIRLEKNRTGQIDLGYKSKYVFDKGFQDEGYVPKEKYISKRQFEALKEQNKFLEQILIVTVVAFFTVLFVCLWKLKRKNISQTKNEKGDKIPKTELSEF